MPNISDIPHPLYPKTDKFPNGNTWVNFTKIFDPEARRCTVAGCHNTCMPKRGKCKFHYMETNRELMRDLTRKRKLKSSIK